MDNIANSHGFSNWALLMKHAAAPIQSGSVQKYFHFSRSAIAMREAFKKVKVPPYSPVGPHEEAENRVVDIWDEFGSALNAVDFAIDYMMAALEIPRFSVSAYSVVYWEMRTWLPYEVSEFNECTQILVNRRYKPVGKGGEAWVNYEGYEHLSTRLTETELAEIAHRPGSEGYLYADGSGPWVSRVTAKKYLERLKKLQSFLKQ